jgi:hypothetical protein
MSTVSVSTLRTVCSYRISSYSTCSHARSVLSVTAVEALSESTLCRTETDAICDFATS